MSASPVNAIVIRRAVATDLPAITDLAGLDSAHVPSGDILLAEVDSVLRAAVSLEDGSSIADPFFRTAGLVALLEVEARQIKVRERANVVPLHPRPRTGLRVAS